ncbi:unnamed protein product [Caenorhabditis bovis]|uniref:BHLH domain-containing protein n=1 Tax=Caenorhabditis bovis TaxID=2654633 RepID=A0A8S1EA82_9PELO|nr:unnamed protein product [Caenorhabditis bovis]
MSDCSNISTRARQSKSQAQQRRQLENFEFSQLAHELPLARAISGQHIDKTTMVRLALSYIKLNKIFEPIVKNELPDLNYYYGFDISWLSNHLEHFDGFFIILDAKCDMLYISETISIYLGLSQVEMTGISIYDYIHEQDIECFNNAIRYSAPNWPQMCNIRLKSSLTKRSNKDTIRSSPGYKVIRVEVTNFAPNVRLIACYPLPTPVLSTITVSQSYFVIITSIDFRITYADDRAQQLLTSCYLSDIKGFSLYLFIDVSDSELIRKMHYEIFNLGAYRTPYYRMILNQTSTTFYVETNVFRYTSSSPRNYQDSITFVTSIL